MFSRRKLLAGGMAAPFAARWGLAHAAATAPSFEAFFRPATVTDAALSPDGQQIAVLVQTQVGDKRRAHVNLLKTGDPEGRPIQTLIGDFDVQMVEWASNERLLVWLIKEGRLAPGLYAPYRRVLSMSLDGKSGVMLFGEDTQANRSNFDLGSIVDYLPDDPRHVLMESLRPQDGNLCLQKVDVHTGEAELIERGAAETYGWFCHDGHPVIRLDSNRRGTVVSIQGRAPGENTWKLIRKVRRDEFRRMDFEIMGGSREPGHLLVRVDHEGAKVLRDFDLRTLEYGKVVSRRPDRDVEAAFMDFRGNLIATQYVEDRVAYDFADPAFAPHFEAINGALDDECNVRLFDCDDERNYFLAHVTGPRTPTAFYFYDRRSQRLDLLGDGKPWLSTESLGKVETLSVKTRDGAGITAYLTAPIHSGPRPLVVMPHGGPEVRDVYDFDITAQILAAQGWYVLQPNFRGSGGYGATFSAAGWGQWNGRMMEDIEDALDQVLASGRIASGKVGIFGGSFGGYAALMCAIRRPDQYKAVVSLAGVTDLEQSLKDDRDEGENSEHYQYWLRSIGDPKLDAAKLREGSPARRAKEMKAPVLLIHGLADQVVLPGQSRAMARALRREGKSVEHLEYRDVGHETDEQTFRDMTSRVIAHLAKGFA